MPDKNSFMLEAKDIEKILPHRYPFLLIDKILSIENSASAKDGSSSGGKKIVALKNVTMNEAQFLGHFPGNPIMPGVLIVEAMAQAAAVLFLEAIDSNLRSQYTFVLGAIKDFRFLSPVYPGDQLIIEIEVLKLIKQSGIVKGSALVSGKKAAEGQLFFGTIKKDE
ncbi:MAG: 3-hydroxyacyl-ACP dehydratase FabZ [Candidatus Omnitrophota bacterium]